MMRDVMRGCVRGSLAALMCTTMLAGAPLVAQAQTTVPLEEIIVTARKRAESMQEVPIAVAAFTAEKMDQQLIRDLVDVAQFTPGFQMQKSFGRDGDRPVIRGASNILVADGKVGIFLNGIPYFGDFSSLGLDTAARVEVIKGPQSAVFGRGTLAGAINVVTRQPGDQLEGQATATLGTFNHTVVAGHVMGPITSWLGGELSVRRYDHGGYYENVLTGGRLGAESTVQGSIALHARPVEDITASVRYMRAIDDDSHYAIALQPASQNNCFLTTRGYFCGEVSAPASYAINTADLVRPGLYRTSERAFFDAVWDIGGSGYDLSYQTGISRVDERAGTDQTYDGRTFFNLTPTVCRAAIQNANCAISPYNTTILNRRDAWTHEARLSGPVDGSFRWRLGGYLGIDRDSPQLAYLEATEVGLDNAGDRTNVRNRAVFVAADLDVTDGLTIGLELRRQWDRIRRQGIAYVARDHFTAAQLAQLTNPNPNQVVGNSILRTAKVDATLPRATVSWEAADGVNLYAQYSVGNAPGGFNPLDAPQTVFEEEKLRNYEVGVKTSRWGFDFLNLALFFNEYENQVLTNTYRTATGGFTSYRANIGQTEIRGLELDMQRHLTDGFRVQASYAFIDAEITRGVEPEQALLTLGRACKNPGTAVTNLALPGCFEAASIAGKRPPLVSRHTASLGMRYEAATGWAGLDAFVGADAVYRSAFFDQVMNLASVGAATRVNAQLGLQSEGGLTITLWAKNLLGDDTPQGVLRYVDVGPGVARAPTGDAARGFAITPSAKREFGLTVTQRF